MAGQPERPGALGRDRALVSKASKREALIMRANLGHPNGARLPANEAAVTVRSTATTKIDNGGSPTKGSDK